MAAWLPTAITVGSALAAALYPQAQSYIVSHPSQAVLIAGLWAVLKGLMASPLSANK